MSTESIQESGIGERDGIRYRLEDRGHDTPCWAWTGATVKNGGYGVTENRGSKTVAHRVYYEAAYGPIPDGMVLDHLCSVTVCVNPAHLEVVTQAENCRRGRNTKLSDAQVDELRQLWATGVHSQTELGARFGIDKSYVSRIVNNLMRRAAAPYRKPWSVKRGAA